MSTQFDKIYHGLSPEIGKIRVAASGMAWKGEADTLVALTAEDIKWAQWLRVARNFQLRIGLVNHRRETFDGFTREDHDKLAALVKNYFAVTLETKEVSFKGWNWGATDFQGDELAFTVSDKTAFELPLSTVANTNLAGRAEVSLEYAGVASSSKSKPVGDELVEIRFYVPGTKAKVKGSDDGSQKSDDEKDEKDDDEEDVSTAQVFHDMIKEKSSIGTITVQPILQFDEILVLTPRGRYDMEMYSDFLRLRGKTYDYKILYATISRLFLLPKDESHVLFILGLTTPIRQGQTRYQYLVLQLDSNENITAELNMPDEEIEANDKLQRTYDAVSYEVVSNVFRGLVGKKIIGVGSYKGHSELDSGIKANLKAVQGDLYMLDKYIFFVSKQPTLVELSEIHSVIFSRLGAGASGARTFDLRIVTKNGPEYLFSSIVKDQHDPIESHLKERKVKVKNEVPDAEMLMAAAVGDDSDDDMASINSDGSAPRVRRGNDDDDEDSEDDGDFQASSSDDGSASAGSDSDSGAETVSDASGDRIDISKKSKGKKKKEGETGEDGAKKKTKKKKADDSMDVDGAEKPKAKSKSKVKVKSNDSDAMDVDEARPRPKPKPTKTVKTGGSASADEEPPKKKPKTKKD